MKKFFIICFIFALLGGCKGEQTAVEYYMLHPEKVPAKLDACRQKADADIQQDQSCIGAINARAVIASLLQNLQENPQAYGAKIMQLQIQYANIKEQIEKTNIKDKSQLATLQAQAKDLHYHINVYRGIIRLVGG